MIFVHLYQSASAVYWPFCQLPCKLNSTSLTLWKFYDKISMLCMDKLSAGDGRSIKTTWEIQQSTTSILYRQRSVVMMVKYQAVGGRLAIFWHMKPVWHECVLSAAHKLANGTHYLQTSLMALYFIVHLLSKAAVYRIQYASLWNLTT